MKIDLEQQKIIAEASQYPRLITFMFEKAKGFGDTTRFLESIASDTMFVFRMSWISDAAKAKKFLKRFKLESKDILIQFYERKWPQDDASKAWFVYKYAADTILKLLGTQDE